MAHSTQTLEHSGALNLGAESSTAFPSPGSSFLPPPKPGPIELARPPSGRRSSKKDLSNPAGDSDRRSSTPSITTGSSSTNGLDVNAKTPTMPSGLGSAAPRSANTDPGTPTPRSPTPTDRFAHLPPASPPAKPPSPTAVITSPVIPPPIQLPDHLVEEADDRPSFPSPTPSPGFGSMISQAANNPNRLSTQSARSTTSLTSSRPAPPSPAVSRRGSAYSRGGSRPVSGTSSHAHSRPTSGLNSPSYPSFTSTSVPLADITGASPATPASWTSNPKRDKQHLSMSSINNINPSSISATPTSTSAEPAVVPAPVQRMKIRDYGFPASDPRYTGEGPLAPRPNKPKVLERRLDPTAGPSSSASSASESEDDERWEDEADDDGDDDGVGVGGGSWGRFSWGFNQLQSSWRAADQQAQVSRGDLERNFGDGDVEEEEDEDDDRFEADEVGYGEEDYEDGDGDGDGDGEEGESLLPGLYRALYAFDPEGTAEMRLDEDQIVRVIGRGGGVGWAVVVREGTGDGNEHALVPESYLEPVKLDVDDEAD